MIPYLSDQGLENQYLEFRILTSLENCCNSTFLGITGNYSCWFVSMSSVFKSLTKKSKVPKIVKIKFPQKAALKTTTNSVSDCGIGARLMTFWMRRLMSWLTDGL